MTPTRIPTLVVIAVVCAAGAWGLLGLVYAIIPPLPWTAVPAMLLLAVAEAWSGWSLRVRLRGRGGAVPLHPIAVARMAALAKATALAATIIAGLAAGFLAYVSRALGKSTFRSDAITSGGTLAAALILVAAALYLEYGCRAPSPPGGEDNRSPGRPDAPR